MCVALEEGETLQPEIPMCTCMMRAFAMGCSLLQLLWHTQVKSQSVVGTR